MSCCSRYIDLKCAQSCGYITIPYAAVQDGFHTIEIEHVGKTYTYTLPSQIGQNFEIDLANFNETSTSIFKIIQPEGTYFTTTIDGLEYECFKIKLKINYNKQKGDYNEDYNNDTNNN